MKVCVFRNDDKAIFFGKIPDSFVICPLKVMAANVCCPWIHVFNQGNNSAGNVLVKKEFHAERNFLSRSAAKAKQALMSSLVNSGKSLRIWS